MKYSRLLAVIMVLAFVLCGCTAKTNNAGNTEETQTEVISEENTLDYKVENEVLSTYGDCNYDKLSFTGTYPGISKINEDLNSEYQKFVDDLDAEDGYNTTAEYTLEDGGETAYFCNKWKVENVWHNNEYVSITSSLTWFAGGAHGDTITYGTTYNLSTGEKVAIADIPLKDADRSTTNLLCQYFENYFTQRKNTDEYANAEWEDEAMESAFDYAEDRLDEINYFIDENGINVYFNSYEIHCYAYGRTQITIPFSEFDIEQ